MPYESSEERISQLESQLANARTMHQQLFDNIRDAILIADTDRKIIDCNAAFTRLFGYELSEVAGKLTQYVYADHEEYDRVGQLILANMSAPGFDIDTNYRKKNGAELIGNTRVDYFEDASGNIIGFIGMIRDVTEQRKVERALLDSEESARLIVEASSDGIVVVNECGDIRFINPAAESLIGRSRKDLIGKPFGYPVSGADVSDLIIRHDDGSLRCIQMRASDVEWEHIPSTLLMLRDVSKLRKVEEDLNRNRERLQLAIEGGQCGLWDWNIRSNHVTYSDSWATLFGYDPEEVEQTADFFLSHIHPDDLLKVQGRLSDHVEGKKLIYESEHRMRNKAGKWFWAMDRGKVIERDADGNATRATGLITDISELKKSQEELVQLNHRLSDTVRQLEDTQKQIIQQERLRALGEMASGVAHDFNNQLQMILGFADLLANDPEHLQDYEKSMKRIERIREAGIQASSVVSRMRSFYNQTPDNDLLNEINLNLKVEKVLALSEPKWKDEAMAMGGAIEIDKDLNDIPLVLGHPGELQEVILNLILNAVDAMPRGGRIKIHTESDGKEVMLSISDTGIGMDEDTIAHCMEPFYTTKGPQGTGLGLSVTHGIVQRHQGTLKIISAIGAGATFTLRLPAHHGEVLLHQEETKSKNSEILHILAVDDESQVREVLSQNLQTQGHLVDVACSAIEALSLLEKSSYDLLITDRAMPEMSGDKLAHRARELYPEMPVYMLTGFGEFIKSKGENIPGVDKILAKPITSEELYRALADVSAQRKT